MLQTAGTTNIRGIDEALCGAMNMSREEISAQSKSVLSQIGFPDFSVSQSQLILSLSDAQIVDFVDFVGHQLATEAYVFASLPLCMTESLSAPDRAMIVKGLEDLYKQEGLAKAEECLEEFVRDVLSFYEKEIVERALSTGQRLRAFLIHNNFCDESDAIFALLPDGVTVRNCIALRQLFHQSRLDMRFSDEATLEMAEADVVAEGKAAASAVSWFWTNELDSGNGCAETEQLQDLSLAGNLWFEKSPPVDPREVNARKIQKWWRFVAMQRFQAFEADDGMDWDAAFFDGNDSSLLPTIGIDLTEEGAGHDSVSNTVWT
jgi:hypothetical protein